MVVWWTVPLYLRLPYTLSKSLFSFITSISKPIHIILTCKRVVFAVIISIFNEPVVHKSDAEKVQISDRYPKLDTSQHELQIFIHILQLSLCVTDLSVNLGGSLAETGGISANLDT